MAKTKNVFLQRTWVCFLWEHRGPSSQALAGSKSISFILEPKSLVDIDIWAQGDSSFCNDFISHKSPLQFQLFYLLMHMYICICIYTSWRFLTFLQAQQYIRYYAFLIYLEFVCTVERGPLGIPGPHTGESRNLTFMNKNIYW